MLKSKNKRLCIAHVSSDGSSPIRCVGLVRALICLCRSSSICWSAFAQMFPCKRHRAECKVRPPSVCDLELLGPEVGPTSCLCTSSDHSVGTNMLGSRGSGMLGGPNCSKAFATKPLLKLLGVCMHVIHETFPQLTVTVVQRNACT